MVAPARRPRGRKPTIAPRPRKPRGTRGKEILEGEKRNPPRGGGPGRLKPIGPGKPGRPPRKPGGPGGITTKPTRPGRGGKIGGIRKDKPGGIAGGRGKVGKPRRMKKRVMY